MIDEAHNVHSVVVASRAGFVWDGARVKGRSLTKPEKALHKQLRQIGCCVCRFINDVEMDFEDMESVTAIHHIEGKTKPNAHYLVIPLCSLHHQYGTKAQPSIHANGSAGGKHQFGNVYECTEYDLLEMTEAHLDRPYSSDG